MDRPPTAQSSARPRPSPISADSSFALSGPTDLPDPQFHAYRRDLADRSLAGRVIASHFVEPTECELLRSAAFRAEPTDASPMLVELGAGERFRMLDCRLGWAWGYAGPDERVGYVKAEALGL